MLSRRKFESATPRTSPSLPLPFPSSPPVPQWTSTSSSVTPAKAGANDRSRLKKQFNFKPFPEPCVEFIEMLSKGLTQNLLKGRNTQKDNSSHNA